MKHLYGKAFDHAHEAEQTANAFGLAPVLNGYGPVEVSVGSADGKHWVYLAFEGEYDADELYAATGYRRLD